MLVNRTKNRVISEGVKIAGNALERAKGLMFEKPEKFDYAMVFIFQQEARIESSIHMMFVFFPIDAVYLDAKKKIVDIARNLKPFALNYTPKKAAKYLIELPAGRADSIEVGDVLEW